MPDSITTAFVQEFKATVELILQQMGPRLAPHVTQDTYTGKAASAVEQFGPAEAVKRTQRHADTPNLDVPQAKRWIFPQDYEWGSLIDQQDRLRMIVDPTNPYAQNAAAAMGRAQDDEIIDAFFATAKVGEDGNEDQAFDTTEHQVGVDVGGTASSLNVAKLQAAMRRLMLAHKGELNEPVFAAISSFEHDALLKEIQVVSKDFNSQPVLEDGIVRRFNGVNFILTERLPILNGNRRIPVWVPSGMHLGTWDGMQAQIAQRADKSFAWQIYTSMTIGATRLQPGKVIEIQADDQL